ncbi:MAG TPA: hypothetical protein VF027_10190 [Sphingomicrobium sp.]
MTFGASIVALAGCAREQPPQPANDVNVVVNSDSVATATEARTEGGIPGEPEVVSEPRGPIDPKSPEAAGQVVQHYGALIEQGRFAEAEKLWGDAATAKAFESALDRYSEVHLEIGKPGDMEGAAGSIYVTEPVTFYGKLKTGEQFRRAASIILRRVNDVPGSTEAQRRWHIERIEWAAP